MVRTLCFAVSSVKPVWNLFWDNEVAVSRNEDSVWSFCNRESTVGKMGRDIDEGNGFLIFKNL